MLYNDATYVNLPDGTSSTGARIVFLSGDGGSVLKYPAHQQRSNALLEAPSLQKLCHEPGGCESAFVIGCFLTELI